MVELLIKQKNTYFGKTSHQSRSMPVSGSDNILLFKHFQGYVNDALKHSI